MSLLTNHPVKRIKYNILFFLAIILVGIITSCTKENPQNYVEPTEQTTAIIGAAGGTINLGSNIRVIIPSGALNNDEKITISKYKPSDFFDGDVSNYIVIGCEPDGKNFQKEIEIYFFAPPNLDPTKIEGFAGFIEPESNALEVFQTYGLSIDGQSAIMIKTNHFSKYGGWFWETPPYESSKIEVPHYNQGTSKYCWAAGLQMVCNAINFDPNHEISDIIGIVGVDEQGIGQDHFRWSLAIGNLVQSRVNNKPDRKLWPVGSVSRMDRYLMDRLALGFPVLVYSPVQEHAFLLVGYDGSTFFINDPASVDFSGSLTMKQKEWSDFKIDNLELNAKFVTLSIPIKMPVEKHLQTVNIGPGELYFKTPGNGFETTKINYTYNSESNKGYGFKNYSGNFIDPIPGNVQELTLKNIQLANSSLTKNANFTVQTSVLNKNEPTKNFKSPTSRITVNANSMGSYSITIPVSKFQSIDKDGSYFLLVETWDESSTLDKMQINFDLKKPEEEIIDTFNYFNGCKFYVYFYGDLTVKDKATLITRPEFFNASWGATLEKKNGALVKCINNVTGTISSSQFLNDKGEDVILNIVVDNIKAPTKIISLYYESKISLAGLTIFKSCTAQNIPFNWGTTFEPVNLKNYVTNVVYIENNAIEEKTLKTAVLDSNDAYITGELIK